jgi:hypothetical protein
MVVETHAVARESIKTGRADMLIAVTAQRIPALLVGDNKQEIRTIMIFHSHRSPLVNSKLNTYYRGASLAVAAPPTLSADPHALPT